jgi:hypothetical protein
MLRAFAWRLMHKRSEVHLGVRRKKTRAMWCPRAGGEDFVRISPALATVCDLGKCGDARTLLSLAVEPGSACDSLKGRS